MQDQAPPPPSSIDVSKPSAARMYDWYLGGQTNYAADREFGKIAVDLFPQVVGLARQNRTFLGRFVRHALDAGIRQFLDLGSGVPTAGNVHEIVRDHLPKGEQAKVVYVDYEHVAVAHAEVLLEEQGATDWAGVVQADLRDPLTVFHHTITQRLLDRSQPLCVMMIAVLHFVGGADDVPELLQQYARRLAPGSWLGITHIASDEASPEDQDAVEQFRRRYDQTTNPLWVRDRAEIGSWFDGLQGWDLVEPGLVHLPDWRPDPDFVRTPEQARLGLFSWCAAAQKRG